MIEEFAKQQHEIVQIVITKNKDWYKVALMSRTCTEDVLEYERTGTLLEEFDHVISHLVAL